MGKTHILRTWDSNRKVGVSRCCRTMPDSDSQPAIWNEPERADCLTCLQSLFIESMAVAEQASRNANALGARIEQLRRAKARKTKKESTRDE